ncbi:MAG: M6 family metalloprotease domain-containing protein [Paludibacteraceae bacterium]|nr:M6 family metalloprotease domain-containing protein [Paludibacteraceae bacterium]
MRKIILCVVFTLFAIALFAVPARKTPILYTQPDGSKITLHQHGDEFYHYTTDSEGNIVVLNEQGFYVKADENKKNQLATIRKKATLKHKARANRKPEFVNLSPRGIVILVQFPTSGGSGSNGTLASFTNTVEDFSNMLNKTGYNPDFSFIDEYDNSLQTIDFASCAREYFEAQSYGKYSPQFDVFGVYTLKNKSSYYAGNDGSEKAHYMIQEACRAAQADGADFSQYDGDGDGEVDFVFVFYAGYGQADGGGTRTIWPHMWWLDDRQHGGKSNYSITLDGKKISMFACTNEISFATKKMDGISTFCHEFSHVCGLPDLYDTDYNHATLGDWDLMDAGTSNNYGYTPPSYSAYERFYCGWITPTILYKPQESVKLENLNTSQEAYLICKDGEHNLNGEVPSPTTFYLLENRQQTKGGYDEFLPGHGMIVTKIQYNATTWADNEVNNAVTSKQGVALVCANGSMGSTGYQGSVFTVTNANNAYPAGKTSFKPTDMTNYSCTNIKETSGVITFDFANTSYVEPTEPTYSYEWESTEKTDIVFNATNLYFGQSSIGKDTVYLVSDNAQATLLYISGGEQLYAGTYQINSTGDVGTFFASPGGDDTRDYPSVYITGFNGQGSYSTVYYLKSGTVNIEIDGSEITITIDAVTHNGSTIHISYTNRQTALEETATSEFVKLTTDGIEVEADGKQVVIYTPLGQTLYSTYINGKKEIKLPKGQVYIIRRENEVTRILK